MIDYRKLTEEEIAEHLKLKNAQNKYIDPSKLTAEELALMLKRKGKKDIDWSKYYSRKFRFNKDSVSNDLSTPVIFKKNSLVEVYYDRVTNDIVEVGPKMTRETLNQFMEDGSLVELKNEGIGGGIGMTLQQYKEEMPDDYEPPETLYGNFTNRNIKLFLGALISGALISGFLIYKYNKK